MHDAAPCKVPETEVSQPATLGPAPVHRDRVQETRHDGAEDDIAGEVAPLRDSSRDDCGTSGGEGALNKKYAWLHVTFNCLLIYGAAQEKWILSILVKFLKVGVLKVTKMAVIMLKINHFRFHISRYVVRQERIVFIPGKINE